MGFKPIFEEERLFFKEKTGIDLPTDCWRSGSKIYLDFTQNKALIEFKVVEKEIKITKNRTNGYKEKNKKEILYLPQQKKIKELIKLKEENLKTLYEQSYNFLYTYLKENANKYFVFSHSGGKDSSLSYEIFMKTLEELKQNNININYEISFANTSNETADTYKIIKSLPKDKLKILNPKEGFYQWIKRKNYFIPSALTRNCCSTYKEGQVNKHYDKNKEIIMIFGLRKYESSKRANYDWIMDYDFLYKLFDGKVTQSKLWVKVAPIIEWKDEDVWLYIIKNKIDINKQYYLGFNRCGCLICPYQSDYVDLLTEKYYPKLWNRWVEDILPKNYINTNTQERYKWSLEEWKNGKWKLGTSKVFEITKNKPTIERIDQISKIMNISQDIAIKYFDKKCSICNKKLNPTHIGMNLKIYGRNMKIEEMKCKKHLCEENGLTSNQYNNMVVEFRDGGCNLF